MRQTIELTIFAMCLRPDLGRVGQVATSGRAVSGILTAQQHRGEHPHEQSSDVKAEESENRAQVTEKE
jgi:hypothetical protein